MHIANSGKLIVKSSLVPNPGTLVLNSNKKKIGKVNNVFGPTKNPYVSINLYRSVDTDEIKKNYGEKIFISKNNKKRFNKRGNKPRRKR
ncbi:Gar1/Naf1 family protein [Methanobrevibacter sp. DSM 116169]|uniref:Gar1/Naf1 family protein n=1 Tax=Methanobrevibacter sp. DSM 116169 TaxID=3242727 RepID=UPI0038FCFF4F